MRYRVSIWDTRSREVVGELELDSALEDSLTCSYDDPLLGQVLGRLAEQVLDVYHTESVGARHLVYAGPAHGLDYLYALAQALPLPWVLSAWEVIF